MNPYQPPEAENLDNQGIRIVQAARGRIAISATVLLSALTWFALFQVTNGYLVWGGITAFFALVFSSDWLIQRIKENRIRVTQPQFGGKRALWGGHATLLAGWFSRPSGTLYLTIEAVIFQGKNEGLLILLDDLAAVKNRGTLLLLTLENGKIWRLKCRGAGQWKALIEIMIKVREERRIPDGRSAPLEKEA